MRLKFACDTKLEGEYFSILLKVLDHMSVVLLGSLRAGVVVVRVLLVLVDEVGGVEKELCHITVGLKRRRTTRLRPPNKPLSLFNKQILRKAPSPHKTVF